MRQFFVDTLLIDVAQIRLLLVVKNSKDGQVPSGVSLTYRLWDLWNALSVISACRQHGKTFHDLTHLQVPNLGERSHLTEVRASLQGAHKWRRVSLSFLFLVRRVAVWVPFFFDVTGLLKLIFFVASTDWRSWGSVSSIVVILIVVHSFGCESKVSVMILRWEVASSKLANEYVVAAILAVTIGVWILLLLLY